MQTQELGDRVSPRDPRRTPYAAVEPIVNDSARFSRALQLIEGEALIALTLEPRRERAALAVLEMVKRARQSAAPEGTASSRRAA